MNERSELTVEGLDLPLPAVLVDGGEVVAFNERTTRVVPHATSGVPFASWFDEGDAEIVAGAFRSRRGEPSVAQVRGQPVWVELHARAESAATRHLVLLRDATDEQFVRAAVDAVADSTFVIDPDGSNKWRSARLRRRSGMADEEAARRPSGERIHPEDLPVVFEAFAAVTEERPLTVRARSRSVDDDDVWETIDIVVFNRLHDPVLRGYLVQVHNLDEGRTITTALSEADPQLLSLTDAAPVGIAVTDPAGQIVYRNPQAKALLGPDVQSFAGDEWLELARPEDRERLGAAVDAGLRDNVEAEVTAGFVGSDAWRWLRIKVVPQKAEGADRTKGVILTIEDVTEEVMARSELVAIQEQLRHLATHDPLTGLPNRAALLRELARAVARHEREQSGLAVLFCDLDDFKPVNDKQGHAGGDAVLRVLAGRLETGVREVDYVARLGGDEFVVLCEGIGSSDEVVRTVADRLQHESQRPIETHDGRAELGLSIGVALMPPGTLAGASDLLLLADQAMYQAKAAGGRGTVTRSLAVGES